MADKFQPICLVVFFYLVHCTVVYYLLRLSGHSFTIETLEAGSILRRMEQKKKKTRKFGVQSFPATCLATTEQRVEFSS